jgi:putative phosphoesterase
MLVGVLSDTHGLLRPQALAALEAPGRKLDHILHAGDVGDPAISAGPGILARLRQIAPVTAIRGNVDTSGPCASLPATEAIELRGCLIYMLHALADLDLHPHAAGIGAVIYGHSHRPSIDRRDGVLYLNPGSAGPRRFRLPVTLALLRIDGGIPSAEILPLLP